LYIYIHQHKIRYLYPKPRKMKRKIIYFILLFSGSKICFAQQALSTAGGEGSGTGGTVSYSIGQVGYTTNIESAGTVTQGVQQPYEIFDIGSSIDDYGINLEFSVFPNPTSDYLKLKVKDYTNGSLTYQLYDANGKLLESKKLDGAETYIQVDMLAPSNYFLKVTDNDKEMKVFKIIKY
jgi:hypothetical protein